MLVILSAQHQARALGCAGHPIVTTANLDALAARGVRFTNAYTPSPNSPSAQAAFATGKHIHETGYWDGAMPYDGAHKSWGHALQLAGVHTAAIGKLHFRADGGDYGFDQVDLSEMVDDRARMVWGSVRSVAERKPRPGLGDQPAIDPCFDRSVTRKAIQWLRAAPTGQPWCLYVGFGGPQTGQDVLAEFEDIYTRMQMPTALLDPKDRGLRHPWVDLQASLMDKEGQFASPQDRLQAMRTYFSQCSILDHNVGELLAALDDTGLRETTTVIYSSDQGVNLGAQGLWGKSGLYEDRIAIPLIMAGPKVAANTCDTPVSLLDMSATIAAQFDVTGFRTSVGVMPLGEVMALKAPQDRAVMCQYHAEGSVSGGFVLRQGAWKLIYYVGFDPELFDLEDDPEESRSLADDPEHFDTLSTMFRCLIALLYAGIHGCDGQGGSGRPNPVLWRS